MQRVAVVDLGMGNLGSVRTSLRAASTLCGRAITIDVTDDPEALRRADRIVMPGQGAFTECARHLAGGMGDSLRERLVQGTPYLGICLGLQALFDESEEAPSTRGLSLLRGRVRRIPPTSDDRSSPAKVPHMGWNDVEAVGSPPTEGALSVLARRPAYFYFVHSFHAEPEDESLVAAVARHGTVDITAAIQKENLVATQFHPEKSQGLGLQLLAAFLAS